VADSWLRFDLDILDHPKNSKLIAQHAERGFVSYLRLLIHAARFNRDGRFDGLTARDLASIARIPGKKSEEFIQSLVALKLLDFDGEIFSVHNWAKRQPFLATAEERSARNAQIAIDGWARRTRRTAPEDGDQAESKRQQAQALLDSYNAIVKRLPKAEKLNAQRIAHACARLKEHTPEELATLFKRLDDSDFAVTGFGSFDWLIKSESNLMKVREGQYDNHRGKNGAAVRPMPTGSEYLERLENRT